MTFYLIILRKVLTIFQKKGLTYNVFVHFIDFLGSDNLITFNNIYYVNNDINSLKDLYGFLQGNIYKIICDKKNIYSFTNGNAKLYLIGIIENSNLVLNGYDFDEVVIG